MNDLPVYFELNIGETQEVIVDQKSHSITLYAIEHLSEPDYWIEDNLLNQTYCAARIHLSVDGTKAELWHRPYQMPETIGNLRLYIETTREWGGQAVFETVDDISKDVRFSAVAAGKPWGPTSSNFPIANFRWRSSAYNNTWSALVPYNLLYYHRGDDFGAIPDKLDVRAIFEGKVTASPVPEILGSNIIKIQSANGMSVLYAHMNIETIDPDLTPGTHVKAGQILGKTGCTWNGYRSQHNDPHLHVGLTLNESRISSYPFLVEAYLRDYGDNLLPIAGGYHFTTVCRPITLDASRSVVRAGKTITQYQWILHDGSESYHPLVEVSYDHPGQYSEEVLIKTDDGDEGRDYAHVRVYEVGQKPSTYGWVYAWPMRDISIGEDILFWIRLVGVTKAVSVDFGDGSPIRFAKESCHHHYDREGYYTVTFSTTDKGDNPVISKIGVEVRGDSSTNQHG